MRRKHPVESEANAHAAEEHRCVQSFHTDVRYDQLICKKTRKESKCPPDKTP